MGCACDLERSVETKPDPFSTCLPSTAVLGMHVNQQKRFPTSRDHRRVGSVEIWPDVNPPCSPRRARPTMASDMGKRAKASLPVYVLSTSTSS
ncbi:hypothetical protein IF2G_04296 [Cordyceps javanica]|nr:hypothetical protein IF2G_04296 [Cordyceps javanica]